MSEGVNAMRHPVLKSELLLKDARALRIGIKDGCCVCGIRSGADDDVEYYKRMEETNVWYISDGG